MDSPVGKNPKSNSMEVLNLSTSSVQKMSDETQLTKSTVQQKSKVNSSPLSKVLPSTSSSKSGSVKKIDDSVVSKKESSPKKKFYTFMLQANQVTVKKQSKLYTCDVCGASYRHVFSLKRHFLRNHITVKYISKADVSNCKIVSHHDPDSASLGNDSDESSVSSRSSGSKKRHRSGEGVVTSDLNLGMAGLYRCHLCPDAKFDTKLELKMHYSVHPSSSKVRFPCSKCGAVFSHKQTLLRHLATHVSSNSFTCKTCGKRFDNKATYVKHIHTHTDSRKCKYCSKILSTSANKRRHERIHEGLKPYPCKYCSSQFGQSSELKKHLKQEHHIAYLSCNLCSRMFLSKVSLNKHMADHPAQPIQKLSKEPCPRPSASQPSKTDDQNEQTSPPKSYACTVCKKVCPTYITMVRHRRQHHPFVPARKMQKRIKYSRGNHQKVLRRKNNPEKTEEEFYLSVSSMIADNLLNHVDGKTSQLSLRQYNFSDQMDHGTTIPTHPWSMYNFPSNFDVDLALRNRGQEIKNRLSCESSMPFTDSFIPSGFEAFDCDSNGVYDFSQHDGSSSEISDSEDINNSSVTVTETEKLTDLEIQSVLMCCVCKEKFSSHASYDDHCVNNHPNVLCTYIEIESESGVSPVIPDNLGWHYLSPVGVCFACNVPPPISEKTTVNCTKCKAVFSNAPELHQHIIHCGGGNNETATRKHVRKLFYERRIKRTMKHRMNTNFKPSFNKRTPIIPAESSPSQKEVTSHINRHSKLYKNLMDFRPKPAVGRPRLNLCIKCPHCVLTFRNKTLLNAHVSRCSRGKFQKPKSSKSLSFKKQTSVPSLTHPTSSSSTAGAFTNPPIEAAVNTENSTSKNKKKTGPLVAQERTIIPISTESNKSLQKKDLGLYDISKKNATVAILPQMCSTPFQEKNVSNVQQNSSAAKRIQSNLTVKPSTFDKSVIIPSLTNKKNITVMPTDSLLSPIYSCSSNQPSESQNISSGTNSIKSNSPDASVLTNAFAQVNDILPQRTDNSRERLSPSLELLVNSIKQKLSSDELSPSHPTFSWMEDEHIITSSLKQFTSVPLTNDILSPFKNKNVVPEHSNHGRVTHMSDINSIKESVENLMNEVELSLEQNFSVGTHSTTETENVSSQHTSQTSVTSAPKNICENKERQSHVNGSMTCNTSPEIGKLAEGITNEINSLKESVSKKTNYKSVIYTTTSEKTTVEIVSSKVQKDSVPKKSIPLRSIRISNFSVSTNSGQRGSSEEVLASGSKITNDTVRNEQSEATRNEGHRCPNCSLNFAYFLTFKRHLKICRSQSQKRVDPEQPAPNSQCQLHLPKKDEVEASMLNLLRHQSRQSQIMKEAKPDETEDVKRLITYTCDICHKIFLSLFKLLQHRVVHKLQNADDQESSINKGDQSASSIAPEHCYVLSNSQEGSNDEVCVAEGIKDSDASVFSQDLSNEVDGNFGSASIPATASIRENMSCLSKPLDSDGDKDITITLESRDHVSEILDEKKNPSLSMNESYVSQEPMTEILKPSETGEISSEYNQVISEAYKGNIDASNSASKVGKTSDILKNRQTVSKANESDEMNAKTSHKLSDADETESTERDMAKLVSTKHILETQNSCKESGIVNEVSSSHQNFSVLETKQVQNMSSSKHGIKGKRKRFWGRKKPWVRRKSHGRYQMYKRTKLASDKMANTPNADTKSHSSFDSKNEIMLTETCFEKDSSQQVLKKNVQGIKNKQVGTKKLTEQDTDYCINHELNEVKKNIDLQEKTTKKYKMSVIKSTDENAHVSATSALSSKPDDFIFQESIIDKPELKLKQKRKYTRKIPTTSPLDKSDQILSSLAVLPCNLANLESTTNLESDVHVKFPVKMKKKRKKVKKIVVRKRQGLKIGNASKYYMKASSDSSSKLTIDNVAEPKRKRGPKKILLADQDPHMRKPSLAVTPSADCTMHLANVVNENLENASEKELQLSTEIKLANFYSHGDKVAYKKVLPNPGHVVSAFQNSTEGKLKVNTEVNDFEFIPVKTDDLAINSSIETSDVINYKQGKKKRVPATAQSSVEKGLVSIVSSSPDNITSSLNNFEVPPTVNNMTEPKEQLSNKVLQNLDIQEAEISSEESVSIFNSNSVGAAIDHICEIDSSSTVLNKADSDVACINKTTVRTLKSKRGRKRMVPKTFQNLCGYESNRLKSFNIRGKTHNTKETLKNEIAKPGEEVDFTHVASSSEQKPETMNENCLFSSNSSETNIKGLMMEGGSMRDVQKKDTEVNPSTYLNSSRSVVIYNAMKSAEQKADKTCPFCHKVFYSVNYKQRHIQLKHQVVHDFPKSHTYIAKKKLFFKNRRVFKRQCKTDLTNVDGVPNFEPATKQDSINNQNVHNADTHEKNVNRDGLPSGPSEADIHEPVKISDEIVPIASCSTELLSDSICNLRPSKSQKSNKTCPICYRVFYSVPFKRRHILLKHRNLDLQQNTVPFTANKKSFLKRQYRSDLSPSNLASEMIANIRNKEKDNAEDVLNLDTQELINESKPEGNVIFSEPSKFRSLELNKPVDSVLSKRSKTDEKVSLPSSCEVPRSDATIFTKKEKLGEKNSNLDRTCPICFKVFYSVNYQQRHIQLKHKGHLNLPRTKKVIAKKKLLLKKRRVFKRQCKTFPLDLSSKLISENTSNAMLNVEQRKNSMTNDFPESDIQTSVSKDCTFRSTLPDGSLPKPVEMEDNSVLILQEKGIEDIQSTSFSNVLLSKAVVEKSESQESEKSCHFCHKVFSSVNYKRRHVLMKHKDLLDLPRSNVRVKRVKKLFPRRRIFKGRSKFSSSNSFSATSTKAASSMKLSTSLDETKAGDILGCDIQGTEVVSNDNTVSSSDPSEDNVFEPSKTDADVISSKQKKAKEVIPHEIPLCSTGRIAKKTENQELEKTCHFCHKVFSSVNYKRRHVLLKHENLINLSRSNVRARRVMGRRKLFPRKRIFKGQRKMELSSSNSLSGSNIEVSSGVKLLASLEEKTNAGVIFSPDDQGAKTVKVDNLSSTCDPCEGSVFEPVKADAEVTSCKQEKECEIPLSNTTHSAKNAENQELIRTCHFCHKVFSSVNYKQRHVQLKHRNLMELSKAKVGISKKKLSLRKRLVFKRRCKTNLSVFRKPLKISSERPSSIKSANKFEEKTNTDISSDLNSQELKPVSNVNPCPSVSNIPDHMKIGTMPSRREENLESIQLPLSDEACTTEMPKSQEAKKTCPFCSKVFSSVNYKLRHIKLKHMNQLSTSKTLTAVGKKKFLVKKHTFKRQYKTELSVSDYHTETQDSKQIAKIKENPDAENLLNSDSQEMKSIGNDNHFTSYPLEAFSEHSKIEDVFVSKQQRKNSENVPVSSGSNMSFSSIAYITKKSKCPKIDRTCPLCHKVFYSVKFMQRHVQQKHEDGRDVPKSKIALSRKKLFFKKRRIFKRQCKTSLTFTNRLPNIGNMPSSENQEEIKVASDDNFSSNPSEANVFKCIETDNYPALEQGNKSNEVIVLSSCSEPFHSDEIKATKKSESQIRDKTCPFCQKIFYSVCYKQRHIQIKHKDIIEVPKSKMTVSNKKIILGKRNTFRQQSQNNPLLSGPSEITVLPVESQNLSVFDNKDNNMDVLSKMSADVPNPNRNVSSCKNRRGFKKIVTKYQKKQSNFKSTVVEQLGSGVEDDCPDSAESISFLCKSGGISTYSENTGIQKQTAQDGNLSLSSQTSELVTQQYVHAPDKLDFQKIRETKLCESVSDAISTVPKVKMFKKPGAKRRRKKILPAAFPKLLVEENSLTQMPHGFDGAVSDFSNRKATSRASVIAKRQINIKKRMFKTRARRVATKIGRRMSSFPRRTRFEDASVLNVQEYHLDALSEIPRSSVSNLNVTENIVVPKSKRKRGLKKSTSTTLPDVSDNKLQQVVPAVVSSSIHEPNDVEKVLDVEFGIKQAKVDSFTDSDTEKVDITRKGGDHSSPPHKIGLHAETDIQSVFDSTDGSAEVIPVPSCSNVFQTDTAHATVKSAVRESDKACPVCGKTFYSVKFKQRHVAMKHKEPHVLPRVKEMIVKSKLFKKKKRRAFKRQCKQMPPVTKK